MDIQVNNLDQGYNQCEELNNMAAREGEKLISDLGSDITNLKAHWKGSDATVHINNLIKVYDALISLATDAKGVTSVAANKIIAMQQVRQSNGGAGMVGNPLPSSAPNAGGIGPVEETSEYYCDPSAKGDYDQLVQICTDYNAFRNNFQTKKDELLSNWTAGADRGNAVNAFNEFEQNAETYNTYLTNAKENLGIAVSNLSQL